MSGVHRASFTAHEPSGRMTAASFSGVTTSGSVTLQYTPLGHLKKSTEDQTLPADTRYEEYLMGSIRLEGCAPSW